MDLVWNRSGCLGESNERVTREQAAGLPPPRTFRLRRKNLSAPTVSSSRQHQRHYQAGRQAYHYVIHLSHHAKLTCYTNKKRSVPYKQHGNDVDVGFLGRKAV